MNAFEEQLNAVVVTGDAAPFPEKKIHKK
jgi:hypothetical protein